ncbi:MAG: menH [Acidobacteria bacterium]|nr:menH [Acidobacteriota bacterium]
MIVALPGFLGHPSDWDSLRLHGFDVESRSYFDDPEVASIEEYADRLASQLCPGDTLLGYSMGGRLALEALARGARVARAVIVSAGLGVEGVEARQTRRAADEAWAARFEHEPWDQVLAAWNAQPLFGGHAMVRDERDYDRRALAAVLRRWSPAVQQPLAARLPAIDIPVVWLAGERDPQYVAEGRRAASLLPNAGLRIIPGAGHRLPWETPEALIAVLHSSAFRG